MAVPDPPVPDPPVPAGGGPETGGYRLPRTVIPEHYDLELVPDLAAATFAGTAVIRIVLHEPVAEVVLNAADLDVTSARLVGAAGSAGPPGAGVEPGIGLDPDTERLVLSVPGGLAAGTWHLHLSFTGELNDKLHGFYRSSFPAADGTTTVIATTQFEPADARRAFPCWDEPDFKATYSVSLVVDDGLTALSNGAAISDDPLAGTGGPGRRRVTFATTMPMSSYLVAFVVGPFETTEPADVDGVPLRVAAVPGKGSLTGFAVEVGSHALRFLAEYFGLPYPSDKLDHVAIPDFAFGAMENLGCVTYRETALLADPATASQMELRRVAQVVAHETAHMWFGDLVTMRWWNGIWLNEAFATFMELTTTDHFRPEWQSWTAFGASRAAALGTDGLAATRPVEFTVGPPAEAEAMFDVLTYEKGGSVLKMLEQYLGPEAFRLGIAAYLAQHRYANTETTDLWDAIEASSGEPVRQIMDSWIYQGGYPLVSAALGSGGRSVTLTQRRFLYAEGGKGVATAGGWVVPVNLRASVGGRVVHHRSLLAGDEVRVALGGAADWVVVNDGAWGFYRVAYSPGLLDALTGHLDQLDALERMALVGDTWARVVAGDLDLEGWVDVVGALGPETDPDVWLTILSPLDLLDLVASEADRKAVRAFATRTAGPALQRLGWDPPDGEDQRQGTLRARLVSALGILAGDDEVRAEALRRFERFRADPGSLHPDLVAAVVHVVAAAGGREAYETMVELGRRSATPQEQIRYLYALTMSDDTALLARTLDACLGDQIRTQDAPMLVGRMLGTRAGGQLTWRWLEGHWDQVLARFPSNIIPRMIEGITALVDPEVGGRARAFLADHPLPQAGPRLAQLLERMEVNTAFAGRVGPGLAAALKGGEPEGGEPEGGEPEGGEPEGGEPETDH